MIDGVAINGVSGRPVIHAMETDGIQIVDTVSEFQANRATGETLQSFLMAQDVSHFHDVTRHVKGIDEVNKKKTVTDESKENSKLE